MSADEKHFADNSLLAMPLRSITWLVLRFPRTVLVVGMLLAIFSVVFTANFLGFRTSRLDLLNPGSAYNQRWLNYIAEFGDQDDVIIVVEGEQTEQIIAAIDDLAETLSHEKKYFRATMHQKELSKLRGKGLHYLSSEQLQQLDSFTESIQPMIDGDWNQLSIGRQIDRTIRQLAQLQSAPPQSVADPQQRLARLTENLLVALGQPQPDRALWPELDELNSGLSRLDSEYFLSEEGRLGFVLLRFAPEENQLVRGTAAIDRLRDMIDQIQQRHSEVKIGLTGMPILENDEMRSSQSDMIRASLLSLVGVSVLFIVGFGGIKHPLLTVATLLISMAWSFGYVTWFVGHLNILSVSFGVILIGLGIDFGIHYVARYLQLRQAHLSSETALLQTASSVGPGIVTGGLTTAIAFFSAGITDFTGVAELGIIAGGGIVLCMIGALLLLPAMIHIMDRNSTQQKAPSPLSIDLLLQPIVLFPRPILIVALAFTAVIAAGTAGLRYDHNLLNLQPRRIESVRLERLLTDGSDRSVWFAISIADTPEQLLEIQSQFDRLDCVDRTEEIVSLLPESDSTKSRLIARIVQRLARLPQKAPLIAVTDPRQFKLSLSQLQGFLGAGGDQTGKQLARMQSVQDRLMTMSDALCYQRVSHYQQRSANELLLHLQQIKSMANPVAPQLEDIPSELRARFIGSNQKNLLRVYARGNVWDMHELENFVAAIESVDPRVTGHPVQTYYASRQMLRSYLHAAIYALLAVAIVLMLDFRSIRHALLALLPMLLGLLQLFGILGLLDIPLNPANMIVLPLILGIGIDDGVHVVHDFCRQKGPYRLSSSTATAVLLTSLTTMVGFGTMMFARHQGLRSLGQVLTIGVFCCLCTSVIILPALLAWITRHRSWDDEEQLEDERRGRGKDRLRDSDYEEEDIAVGT